MYLIGGGKERPVNGFAAFAPLPGFVPGEGVPVVALEPGQSPRQWLITEPYRDAMRLDPMLDPGDYASLMPNVGDTVLLDDTTVAFKPLAEQQVGPNGGISMAGLKSKDHKSSLIAYTVLGVAEKQTVIVNAGYTAATRIQLVLNGRPVRHQQVLELEPGQYPLLLVLRMAANWGRIEPNLGPVSLENVGLAKEVQAEADAHAAEVARLKDAPRKQIIRKVADLPADRSRDMFWLPPALAEAWTELHTPPSQ